MAIIALLLRTLSFGLLTDYNRKYFVPFCCKLILRSVGIKIINNIKIKQPDTPCFYTFNHNSYLDGFTLMTLGLTKTRFLMSEKMLKYIPVTLTALSIGLLFIPQKKHKERRLRFFKKLENKLKKEKISFAGSSEGVRDYDTGISPFNRGVYHTAMLCKMPIVAIFIYTPLESNPFNKFKPFKSGTVVLEILDIIPTDNWNLDNLDDNIEKVRSLYVQRHDQLFNSNE